LRTLRGLLNTAADSASVDRSLTSVVQRLLGDSLVTRREIPDNPHDAEHLLSGYDIFDDAARDVLEQAMTIVGLAMRPAANEFIVGELTRLRLVTLGADRTEEDLFAAFTFYAEELETRQYPADIVSSACRELARKQKFWPALSEIVDRCDQLLNDRQVLLRALQRGPNLHKPTRAEYRRRFRERLANAIGGDAPSLEEIEVAEKTVPSLKDAGMPMTWHELSDEDPQACAELCKRLAEIARSGCADDRDAIGGLIASATGEYRLRLEQRLAQVRAVETPVIKREPASTERLQPLSERLPAVKAMLEAWRKELGLEEQPAEPNPK
jgi:hypothetical protein